jgi:hypothetical protein
MSADQPVDKSLLRLEKHWYFLKQMSVFYWRGALKATVTLEILVGMWQTHRRTIALVEVAEFSGGAHLCPKLLPQATAGAIGRPHHARSYAWMRCRLIHLDGTGSCKLSREPYLLIPGLYEPTWQEDDPCE